MTKAEKDAIRARVAKYWSAYENNDYDLTDLGGVFAVETGRLLAALDEAEAELYTSRLLACGAGTERFQWQEEAKNQKRRAEALERALREEATCMTCAHVKTDTSDEPCCACDRGQGNLDNWAFDEARFTPEKGANP